jgi:hypothetical protein
LSYHQELKRETPEASKPNIHSYVCGNAALIIATPEVLNFNLFNPFRVDEPI